MATVKVKDEMKEEAKEIKTGLIGFIKDGVTILRDASLIDELANDGWMVK